MRRRDPVYSCAVVPVKYGGRVTIRAPGRLLIVVYLLLGAADLVAVGVPVRWLELATKPLLMPVLVAVLLVVLGRRVLAVGPVLLVVGLVFAWGGDIALLFRGGAAFLVGMALFLVMQLAYGGGFVAAGARGGLRRRWWVPALYAVAGVALVVFVAGRVAAPMVVALAVYGAALFTMAGLAACRDWWLGLGGLLFAVSDVVNGLGSAHVGFTGAALVVMATYVVAQAVIVLRYAALTARRG
jgi:uncharacterized membrane protein YhhN